MAGRFEKVVRIGRGTFGEAWLVTSKCSGRKYVIKEVRVEEMAEEDVEKTKTEATILARCKHSSIIRYKEFFMLTDPKTMCLVMEYADGGDLSIRVKDAKKKGEFLPESSILHWFVQIIFAVQYLHRNNILHRDLKTQNIFLTKTNLVKVGDFGIARFLRNKQDLATTAIGTPYYLSPEICQRRPYNYKSDMWAVGCVLYEMCALRHPFDAENFEDLILKILRGSYRPLQTSFSSLLQDLTSVMLRTNPERRPSADALLITPALKPYVENYLKQHEQLLSSRPISSTQPATATLPIRSHVMSTSPGRTGSISTPPTPHVGGADDRIGQLKDRESGMRSRCNSDSVLSKPEHHAVDDKHCTAPVSSHQGQDVHVRPMPGEEDYVCADSLVCKLMENQDPNSGFGETYSIPKVVPAGSAGTDSVFAMDL